MRETCLEEKEEKTVLKIDEFHEVLIIILGGKEPQGIIMRE